jgi:hypothetical protein
MRGFTIAVTGGAIQRIDGGLCAYWESQAPYTSIQRLIERLGLTRVEATSTATVLSDKRERPTVFESQMSTIFPEGEMMPNLATHEEVQLPFPLVCRLTARATGSLTGTLFSGPFEVRAVYEKTDNKTTERLGEVSGVGEFEFQLR